MYKRAFNYQEIIFLSFVIKLGENFPMTFPTMYSKRHNPMYSASQEDSQLAKNRLIYQENPLMVTKSGVSKHNKQCLLTTNFASTHIQYVMAFSFVV